MFSWIKLYDMIIRRAFLHMLALCLVVVSVSCDKRRCFPCEITISKSADAEMDSVSLYCYESDYHRSREIFTGKVGSDTISIVENSNLKMPRVAYFRLGKDSVCHYFVIEPGKVDVRICKNMLVVTGGGSNRRLFELSNAVRSIDRSRGVIDSLYMKHAADSTLTGKMERRFFKSDSVLADSAQRLLVQFVRNDDAASMIAKELYSKRFARKSWNEMEK